MAQQIPSTVMSVRATCTQQPGCHKLIKTLLGSTLMLFKTVSYFCV